MGALWMSGRLSGRTFLKVYFKGRCKRASLFMVHNGILTTCEMTGATAYATSRQGVRSPSTRPDAIPCGISESRKPSLCGAVGRPGDNVCSKHLLAGLLTRGGLCPVMAPKSVKQSVHQSRVQQVHRHYLDRVRHRYMYATRMSGTPDVCGTGRI
jgi:hypothetical protein